MRELKLKMRVLKLQTCAKIYSMKPIILQICVLEFQMRALKF